MVNINADITMKVVEVLMSSLPYPFKPLLITLTIASLVFIMYLSIGIVNKVEL